MRLLNHTSIYNYYQPRTENNQHTNYGVLYGSGSEFIPADKRKQQNNKFNVITGCYVSAAAGTGSSGIVWLQSPAYFPKSSYQKHHVIKGTLL